MGAVTAYSISVAVILAMEYIVYKSLLAGATFYRFNRVVLLLCYVVALVALPISSVLTAFAPETGDIFAGASTDALVPVAGPERAFTWTDAVPIVYLAGAAVMAALTVISYVRMSRIIRSGEHRNLGDAVMVVAKTRVSPFSWGKYVVLSAEDAGNRLIIDHELTHIRNRHSLDLIFAQLFLIFNWFNPAAYLMRRELSAVHEYEVDRQMLESGANAEDYQMLLIKKTAGPAFHSIANSLNHSQLKNRLTMMLKSRSRAVRRLCAAALPVAAMLAVAMTDIPAVASTIGSVASATYGKGSENSATAQDVVTNEVPTEVFHEAEIQAQYPGGGEAMYHALAAEIKYPAEAYAAHQQGRAVVQFVVNTNGTASDFTILRSAGSELLDAEALRAIQAALTQRWTPASTGGKPVAVYYAMPVTFRL